MVVTDPSTMEKLLFENDLTFAKAIDILKACETSRSQLDQMRTAETSTAVIHRLATSSRRMGNSSRTSISSDQRLAVSFMYFASSNLV